MGAAAARLHRAPRCAHDRAARAPPRAWAALDETTEKLPKQGTLTFRVVWEPSGPRPSPRPTIPPGRARNESVGMLRVHIERGMDLLPADWNGKADPYVDCYIDGKAKSSKKCRGTFRSVKTALNPIWDQTLDFHGSLAGFTADVLLIRVKDWDMLSSDDSMGEARLDIDDLRIRDYASYEIGLKSSKGRGQGSIRLSCQWIAHASSATLAAAGGGGAADLSALNSPAYARRLAGDVADYGLGGPRSPRDGAGRYGGGDDEMHPIGRQRAITRMMNLTADGGEPASGGGRMRSVTMARRARRDTVSAKVAVKRGGRSRGASMAAPGGALADDALGRNFLNDVDGWRGFAVKAFLPGGRGRARSSHTRPPRTARAQLAGSPAPRPPTQTRVPPPRSACP